MPDERRDDEDKSLPSSMQSPPVSIEGKGSRTDGGEDDTTSRRQQGRHGEEPEQATSPGDEDVAKHGPNWLIRALVGAIIAAVVGLAFTYIAAVLPDPEEDGAVGSGSRPPSDAGAPLAVDVIADPGTWLESSPYDVWWLFPEGTPDPNEIPPDLGALGDERSFDRWAAERSALHAHHSMLRIVLRGRTRNAVVVTGLRVRILERDEPVIGWYTVGGGCGLVPVRSAQVDLDTTPPRISYIGADSRQSERPSRSMTLELRRGKPPEVIEVFASTERYSVDWDAEVLYQVEGGQERAIRIDRDGHPFRVTAVTSESQAYLKSYSNDGELALQRQPSFDGQTGIC